MLARLVTLTTVVLQLLRADFLPAQEVPWIVVDTFAVNFNRAREGPPSWYRLYNVALPLPGAGWDTLDFALATGPGWYSDSSLLLVTVSFRLPPDPRMVPEVIGYYEYLLPSASFRRAHLPDGFGTLDISPNGHFAARVQRDEGGFYAEVWQLPEFKVVGRGEYLSCLASDVLWSFEWLPRVLVWRRALCTGTVALPSSAGNRHPES